MSTIESIPIPPDTFLSRYADGGAYADCYVTNVALPVSLAQLIEAFYTTGIFRIERLILGIAAGRPSTDDDVRKLAKGAADKFAAWNVENRDAKQILLADFSGRTRSWLMVEPITQDGVDGARLYFGSAVTPIINKRSGEKRMGAGFQLLLGFHKLYSRTLLYAARARLARALRVTRR